MKTLLSLVLVVAMASVVCAQPPQDKGPKFGPKPQVKQEKPERPMMGPPPWARQGQRWGQTQGTERPFSGKGPAVHHRGRGPQWGYHYGPKQGSQGRKCPEYNRNGGLTITIIIK
jgi:hypothetical protein